MASRILTYVVICSLWMASVQASTSYPQSGRSSEYEVKAAYIYNFTKFIRWPAEAFSAPDVPIRLCLFGLSPFDQAFKALSGELAQGRTLQIQHVTPDDNLAACHILFVGESEKRRLTHTLNLIKNLHVLTVSDMRRFTQFGGMIKIFQGSQ